MRTTAEVVNARAFARADRHLPFSMCTDRDPASVRHLLSFMGRFSPGRLGVLVGSPKQ